MSSFRRIISSRANAAKSTGPKSIAGKRRSSLNALRHGFRSPNVVLLENESPHDFDALLQVHLSHFKPRNPSERSCVDQMAIAIWRTRRLWAVELGLWTHALASQTPGDNLSRLTGAFSLLCTIPAFRALSRYESTLDQAFNRAHRNLLDLRRRENQPQPAMPPNAGLENTICTNEATLCVPYASAATPQAAVSPPPRQDLVPKPLTTSEPRPLEAMKKSQPPINADERGLKQTLIGVHRRSSAANNEFFTASFHSFLGSGYANPSSSAAGASDI